MNKNVTKQWKRRGRKRLLSTGNPNSIRAHSTRIGEGYANRRGKKIVRRLNRRKRLPNG